MSPFFISTAGIFNENTKEKQKAEPKAAVAVAKRKDDKDVLTLIYSGDRRIMTLKEIDTGLQQGIRIPRTVVHQKR